MSKFRPGNQVLINTEYVSKLILDTRVIKRAVEILGTLEIETLTVLETGKVGSSEGILFYIKLRPETMTHLFYNQGQGVVIYFLTEETRDNSFQLFQPPLHRPNPETRAIFTAVQNGNRFIKLWYQYFSKFFQPSDIYILDFKSNDGSLDSLDCQKIRIETDLRLLTGYTYLDGFKRDLLQKYGYIVYADYDEILFHRHGLGNFLKDFREPYVTSVGYEIIQRRREDPPLDFDKTILSQRSFWVRNGNYDKTNILGENFHWDLGHHTLTGKPPKLNPDLYLIHLNKIDFSFLHQLHRKLRQENNPISGGYHLVDKEIEDWWYLTEQKATVIPDWIKSANFI